MPVKKYSFPTHKPLHLSKTPLPMNAWENGNIAKVCTVSNLSKLTDGYNHVAVKVIAFESITLNPNSIMETTLLSVPMAQNHLSFAEEAEYVPYEEVREEEKVSVKSNVNFLEANTSEISIEELAAKCVVPTWANQELTLSHQDFIHTVHEAAQSMFAGETINDPAIRVSHIVRGRVPSALGKRASELLECEKTQFYQRLAFAFTIPTIHEKVNGQKLELCIGGVRNYSDLNLYRASKGVEKFSVFIGWRVNICSNQVLTGDGVRLSFEVMNLNDLYKAVLELFYNFNPAREIHLMQTLSQSYLTETQFAQIVGRMRLYQALPNGYQRSVPRLLITDSQINNVCRDYFTNPNFGAKGNTISMFDFHNLLTESNKSSYIDTYLQRAVNATEVAIGINNALHGDMKYAWFLG